MSFSRIVSSSNAITFLYRAVSASKASFNSLICFTSSGDWLCNVVRSAWFAVTIDRIF